MHATILLHSGIAGHSGRFAARRTELEQLMAGVSGLTCFRLIATPEGVAALVVGRDRAACDECVGRARRWMDATLPDLAARTPLEVSGEVIAGATGPER